MDVILARHGSTGHPCCAPSSGGLPIEWSSVSQKSGKIHEYWDAFYAEKRASEVVPTEPSAFAKWVADDLADERGRGIVEFGSGNGRDAMWFASLGHKVKGFDFSESAVNLAQSHADERAVTATFNTLDLNDAHAVHRAGKVLTESEAELAFYARFLIHSLEDAGRLNLFDLARRCLDGNGNLYLEFRSVEDRVRKHVFGDDHFRVFHPLENIVRELEDRAAKVVFTDVGQGMATYLDEDPVVARIVVAW